MSNSIHYLFSYGTLQDESVQISTFGRLLQGTQDKLIGYRLASLKITDPHVIQLSGKDVHHILEISPNHNDAVEGSVFEVTPDELSYADQYEVSDYKRIQVQLNSGKKAWVYVSVEHRDKL